MNPWVSGVILAMCGVAAVLLVVHLVRDRPSEDGMYLLLALLEVVLLVQLVWGCIALANTDRDVEGAVFVGYLIFVVLAPPAGAFFSLAERSRVGTVILLLAVATVAGMQLRLEDIWSAGG